ncbi:hypothetical protein [Massilia glaciei]|uniref:Uncharacterized protein n=1 Tax=Massilia glaciei TaxID=1524097 RepID=A0A2U2HGT8_9BURK|nr:hypothetical protein [Massilia glaciei]PWF44388.1 hypothetical protein C7C56_019305 [Massilia glaciei]
MVLAIAIAMVVAVGLFLVALGLAALFRPPAARRFLLGFAGSAAKHYAELGIRLAVGAALLIASPSMVGSEVVAGAGLVLLVTTGFMLFLPWRWHRAFALKAVPSALAYLPIIGLSSVALGVAVLWSLLATSAV